MRVAILSESSADEAAVRILAQAILRTTTERHDNIPLRSRGWPSVLNVLRVVIKHLHYNSLADGLIVVVDGNNSPIHAAAHDTQPDARCRLCQLRGVITTTLPHLRAIPNRPALEWAVGVAVPAIEAWYLCGVNHQASEAGWRSGALVRDRNELKRQVYGTSRPQLTVQTAKAREAAERLALNVTDLETRFPVGFGTLAIRLRSWATAL